jgi:predicted ArsR family transcriptional regulator
MKNNQNFYVVYVEDTIKYGIIKASIIGRVRWWCQYNKDNKVKDRFHNGEWWSGFMTPKVFAEQLGIPETTIKNNLVSLTNDEILIKNKFNKKGFDKTNWYRVNPNPPQIQSSYRKDTTIVSERYNDSIGEIQSTVSERYNHSIVEGEPIPVSLSVNQNVTHTDKLPVNLPVNTSLEEQLEHVMKLIIENKFETNDARGDAYEQKSKLEIKLKQLSNE